MNTSNTLISTPLKAKVTTTIYGLSFLAPYIYFWWPWFTLDYVSWPWLIPATTFILVPVLDQLVGDYLANPSSEMEKWAYSSLLFKLLPFIAVPSLLICQWLLAGYFIQAESIMSKLGWLLTAGIAGVVLGINIAHELIHRKSKAEQWTGGLLLASVAYGGFKIEHIYGHHVKVATPEDLSTAPRGMNLYQFWGRTLANTPIQAFKLAQQRASKRKGYNEMSVLIAVSALFLLGYVVFFGWQGGVFWFGQSLISVLFLETINYIEHYGLLRKTVNGKYEPTDHHHSWNSSKAVTNALLFNIQRHSDHHAHASRPYINLRHFEDSPQMPSGYAAMILLSFVPPMWFRKMNKKLSEFDCSVAIKTDAD